MKKTKGVTPAAASPNDAKARLKVGRLNAFRLNVTEPAAATSVGYYKTVTIDHNQCGTVNSSAFPFLIRLAAGHAAAADLRTVANGGKVVSASGYDIRPYNSARTAALMYELVSYDPTTGAIEMWVSLPTLSVSTDTVFTIRFGDTSLGTTNGSSSAVWPAPYKAVLHLRDNAATTAVLDATANANHGTNVATTSTKSSTGQIGAALTYNGTTDVTTLPSIPTLVGVNQISFSCWVKWTTLTNYTVAMVETTADAGNRFGFGLGGPGAGANTGILLVFGEAVGGGSSFAYTTGGLISAGVWYHVVGTYDTTQATPAARGHVYFNGVDQVLAFNAGYAPTTPIANGADPITLARDRATFTSCAIDEAHAYAGVLSPSWVKAEYNNQRTQTGVSDFALYDATVILVNQGRLEKTLAPVQLVGGDSNAGTMTVSWTSCNPGNGGPTGVAVVPPYTTNFITNIFTNEPMQRVITGAPVTVTWISSDPARHDDIVATFLDLFSTLVTTPDLWGQGKGQLGFVEGVNFSGCSGMTFTLSGASPKSNWHHFTSLDGDPIPPSLSGRQIVLTVGPGTLGTLEKTLEPVTLRSRGAKLTYDVVVGLDGAAGYWPLDDPRGSPIARDLVGTRPGTLSPGVLAGRRGLWGRCMAFGLAGGVGSGPGYIDLGAGPPARAAGFTLELWFSQTVGAYSVQRALITKGAGFNEDPPPTPGSYALRRLPNVAPANGIISITTASPIDAGVGGGTTLVSTDEWHHLVVTSTPGSPPTVRLFLDGALDGSGPMEIQEDDSSLTTYIGDFTWYALQGYGWDGLLQAVAWYPSVLTPTQITSHYDLGIAQGAIGARPLSVIDLLGEDEEMPKYNVAEPIVTSDTADLKRITDAIYVGVSGDLAVVLQDGQSRTFTDMSAGSILPVVAKRVNATNTTAAALIALYQK